MSDLDGLWLFNRLPAVEQSALLQRTHRQKFAAGAFVYHAGQPGDTLYVIVKGRVAVLSPAVADAPLTLRILGRGEAFGELALLTDSHRRTATIQAIEPIETLVLNREDFDELRQRHPAVNDLLLASLSRLVERLSAQVAEMYECDGTTRIYRQIVRLGELFEATDTDGVIPITQHQLASIAGVKLRLTNRVLGEAADGGMLSTGKRRIIVHDWPQVRRRSGLRTAAGPPA